MSEHEDGDAYRMISKAEKGLRAMGIMPKHGRSSHVRTADIPLHSFAVTMLVALYAGSVSGALGKDALELVDIIAEAAKDTLRARKTEARLQ